jgi:hypothetical protein
VAFTVSDLQNEFARKKTCEMPELGNLWIPWAEGAQDDSLGIGNRDK